MKKLFPTSPSSDPQMRLAGVLDASANAGHGVYLGHGGDGWCFAGPEQSVMILGPPRSGKTSSLDHPQRPGEQRPSRVHFDQTGRARRNMCGAGTAGTVPRLRPHRRGGDRGPLQPVRWSPLQSCTTWTTSLAMARSLVEVGASSSVRGGARAESSHWTERAQALLAPLLHAASLDGTDMRTLLTWVDRRQALPAQQILAAEPGRNTELARNLLDGIVTTDERELSGIWSTASGALTGFRSDQALDAMSHPDFDPLGLRRPRLTPCTSPHRLIGKAWSRPWWWVWSRTSDEPLTPVTPTGPTKRDPGRRY